MKAKFYQLIEHTADIGVKIRGRDLKQLFAHAAAAMFDLIAEKKEAKILKKQKLTVRQKAESLEELFVNWLNELLSLSATKELFFSHFKINKLNQNNLEAILTGININNYRMKSEIKAATYHELKLEKNKFGWQAEVIFDV